MTPEQWNIYELATGTFGSLQIVRKRFVAGRGVVDVKVVKDFEFGTTREKAQGMRNLMQYEYDRVRRIA